MFSSKNEANYYLLSNCEALMRREQGLIEILLECECDNNLEKGISIAILRNPHFLVLSSIRRAFDFETNRVSDTERVSSLCYY